MAPNRIWRNRNNKLVILDTNAILMCFEYPIDLEIEIIDLIAGYEKNNSVIKGLSFSIDSSETALYLKYENRRKFNAEKSIPGAALLTRADNSNPVAFGLGDVFYTFDSSFQFSN